MSKPTPALRELFARLSDVEADAEFVRRASILRPRLNAVLRWEVGGDEIEIARSFIATSDSRPESLYGALLVRALASLERFLRKAVEAAAQTIASTAKSSDKLPKAFANRHIELTGKALASINTPLDHMQLDATLLIDNLLSCRPGVNEVRINGSVFAMAVSSAKPDVVERALRQIDLEQWWDTIGASDDLRWATGTKRTRECAKAARERLGEACRWRNQIAHGGDEEIALTNEQLTETIKFLRAFASSMDDYVDSSARTPRAA